MKESDGYEVKVRMYMNVMQPVAYAKFMLPADHEYDCPAFDSSGPCRCPMGNLLTAPQVRADSMSGET